MKHIIWIFLIMGLINCDEDTDYDDTTLGEADGNTKAQRHDASFMKILKQVMFKTLKSLNRYDSKLAKFFVEHHPAMKPMYILLVNETNTKVSKNNIKQQPTDVRLSEFNYKQDLQTTYAPMTAHNIKAGFLQASSVVSKKVDAKKIIAKDVLVTTKKHGSSPQLRQSDFKHSKQRQPIVSLTKQTRRYTGNSNPRLQFLNRRDKDHHFSAHVSRTFHKPTARPYLERTIHHRNGHNFQPSFNSENIKRQSYLFKTRSLPVTRQMNVNGEQTKARAWSNYGVQPISNQRSKFDEKDGSDSFFDSWSDSDSEDYFYDDKVQPNTPDQDVELEAENIKTGSMYADSVRARQINVKKVLADEVIVSANLGA